jgi:hypothetical protein
MGGPGLAWGACAGEGGVTLASQSRRLESQLSSASYFGKSFWQAIWASFSGTAIWRGFIASKFGKCSVGFRIKLKLRKEE